MPTDFLSALILKKHRSPAPTVELELASRLSRYPMESKLMSPKHIPVPLTKYDDQFSGEAAEFSFTHVGHVFFFPSRAKVRYEGKPRPGQAQELGLD